MPYTDVNDVEGMLYNRGSLVFRVD